MSIADEITRLQNAKASLKTSIEAKGVTVPEGATLDDYPALVDSISGGGGSKPILPDGTMFAGSTFQSFDLTEYDTSALTTMYNFFSGCSFLTTVDMSNCGNTNIDTLENAFYYCVRLTSVNFNGFITDNVMNLSGMFYGAQAIESIDLSFLTGNYILRINNMVNGCASLVNLNCENLYLYGITNMNYFRNAFYNCPNLSNESLNSILKALSTARPSLTTNRTLKYVGLSETQANTCKTLSNWSLASEAKWTTGYY